jgi:hypothetical protein
MALNVLYTTLHLFQQRTVWHSLFPLFIFQFFVLYMWAVVGTAQAILRIARAFIGIIRAVARTTRATARTTGATARTTRAVVRTTGATARTTRAVVRTTGAAARTARASGGIIRTIIQTPATIQRNSNNITFYSTSHLFNNHLIQSI